MLGLAVALSECVALVRHRRAYEAHCRDAPGSQCLPGCSLWKSLVRIRVRCHRNRGDSRCVERRCDLPRWSHLVWPHRRNSLMKDVYFFDIPIYRLPEAKYNSDRDRYIEQSMIDLHYEKPPMADQFRNDLWKQYGGAWQFNEIIGYIRLYFCRNQILGELWMTNAKRIVQTRRKRICLDNLESCA